MVMKKQINTLIGFSDKLIKFFFLSILIYLNIISKYFINIMHFILLDNILNININSVQHIIVYLIIQII